MVRSCVVDNGNVNSETEIGRSNHCGLINFIKYDNEDMSGCILSCNTDGCNTASPSAKANHYVHIICAVLYLAVCKPLATLFLL